MSQTYRDYGATYEVFANTVKTLDAVIIDPGTGGPMNLGDVTIFTTIKVKVVKSDGTIIGNIIAGSYIDRPNGIVEWTVDTNIANNANAGNWIIEIMLINTMSKQIAAQIANFNILELP